MFGLPSWLSGKGPTCQWRQCGFDPWVGKIPWRRKQQPTPVLLPGKSHGQRSLVGYSPWGCRVRHDRATSLSFTEFKLSCVIISSGPKERKKNKCFKWLRLRNVEKKDVCPFLLLENSRPLSPQLPPDFLSTCLGTDSHFEHLFSLWAPWEHQARKIKDLE